MNVEYRSDMKTECAPIFVVGMNGSGTSMMLDSLGRHPSLYALPDETLMMPYIIERADRYGDLSVDENFQAYWQFAIDQMPALIRFNDGEKPGIPDDWRTYPRTIAGVFDGIFCTFAQRKGKHRWCEKTPDHVQHIPVLAEIFPRARFLHMIRDGREVASSISRRQFRRPELIVYRWKKLVATGQADGGKLGERYLETKYEDLTADPENEMKRICDFVGVEFHPDVLQSRMPQHPEKASFRGDELGKISSNPLKWKKFFDDSQIRKLEKIGGTRLQELGYDVVSTPGDDDPSALLLRYWRVTDFLRIMRERKRTRRAYASWPSVLKKAVFSLKAYSTKRH